MYIMEKKVEQNGNHFLSIGNGSAKSKENEARASMTKSTSGLSNLKQKETIVTISGGDKGCYFSRVQVGVFVFALLLTLSAVIVLVVCFSDSNRHFHRLNPTVENVCKCADSQVSYVTHPENTVALHTALAVRSTSEPFTISDQPEIGIRLPGDVIPVHYDIDLDVSIDNENYTGSVKILTNCLKDTSLLILHVKPYILNVNEAEVYIYPLKKGDTNNTNNKSFIPVTRQFMDFDKEIHAIELKEPMMKGIQYIIYIKDFQGFLFADLKGMYMSSYKNKNGDTRNLIASQLQSTDARKVFPCFDEPDMKATFSVSITHSSEYTALCNMPVESEKCFDDCSRTRVQFQTTPLMSTYLLAFVVSDFDYSETILENNYTLRIWSQPDLINQTYYALDFATKTYAYFTDYFQMPDVVPKADHVAVPDFSGGAMENWGLVIYRETALLYDPEVSSSSNKYMVTLIIAHEIAHTWFGNMVTMKWWDDLWLNEGFASTLMYFAMDNAYPEWNVLDIVVAEDMFPVMVKDALETSHPVSPNINHPDEIAESFDQISYNKGMALLRMLETFLGKDGFRKGLQSYVMKYKFDNAEMSELWETFTEATNSSLKICEIMDTWTRQMGYPVINIKADGDYYILEQTRFLINAQKDKQDIEDSDYGYKWYVPFTYMMEDDVTLRLHWLKMGPGKIKKTSGGWILGNVNYGGFYRVNYELEMWQRLAKQLYKNHTVISPPNRAGLIGDAFNLARASMLDYGLALNLTTYLRNEENYVPWKAFLDCFEFIRGMLSKESAYVALEKYIGELVAPVFAKIGTDDHGTLPEMYLRRLLLKTGCDTGVKAAVQYAKDQFRAWMINGTRLPTDFSQVIYAVGVREGSVDEWDYVWIKSQETNSPSEREMLLEALAHTQKPWLLWRYANWIFDVNKIKMQDVRLVMSYFSNTPLGRMIALHFLMTRWDDLNEKFGDDTFIIREMIGEVTAYVNTEFVLNQLEHLFTEKPPKGAKKGADSAIALIRANIGWMDKNYASIASWLDQHVESSF
ncbi:glutamyl aminopeptidase-like [Mercenaria mercenaria]|uniref:glutamyl aminopeptidase-like n=1 Tax=Mercenaria mercenaria TaxID=6596 RepID=UPI00234EA3D7|nr:glutamyl aminopeptidase-like [Mercenaria mercenaria]